MRYQHLKVVRKIRPYVLPVVCLLVAFTLAYTEASMPNSVRTLGHTVAAPFWFMRDAVLTTVSAQREGLKSVDELLEENRLLREEVTTLQRNTYTTRALQQDNEELYKLLGRTEESAGTVPAAVIHGARFSPYDTFIIDQGTTNGIREDMLVRTSEGIAIGVVTHALDMTSIVTRFSAPEIELDVVFAATTSTHAILSGYGGGTMRALVPRDVPLAVDDPVQLPSFETNIIGSIVSIEATPEDAFKTVYIQSPINMYELRFVVVDTTTVWKAPSPEDQEGEGEERSDI